MVVKKIGHGQYASCWVARDVKLEIFVCLKIYKASPMYREIAIRECRTLLEINKALATSEHFETEIKTNYKIDCTEENVVKFYNCFVHHSANGVHYCLNMELLGMTLEDIIVNYKDLLIYRNYRDIHRSVLLSLALIHDIDVIHTDIKPKNYRLAFPYFIQEQLVLKELERDNNCKEVCLGWFRSCLKFRQQKLAAKAASTSANIAKGQFATQQSNSSNAQKSLNKKERKKLKKRIKKIEKSQKKREEKEVIQILQQFKQQYRKNAIPNQLCTKVLRKNKYLHLFPQVSERTRSQGWTDRRAERAQAQNGGEEEEGAKPSYATRSRSMGGRVEEKRMIENIVDGKMNFKLLGLANAILVASRKQNSGCDSEDGSVQKERQTMMLRKIGSRSIRSPETILKGNLTGKSDVWQAGCLAFRTITQSDLFNPRSNRMHSPDELHLMQMVDLLGPMDEKFITSCKYGRKIMKEVQDKRKGRSSYCSLSELLVETRLNKPISAPLLEFLRALLNTDPLKRPTAKSLLAHRWLNPEQPQLLEEPISTVEPEDPDGVWEIVTEGVTFKNQSETLINNSYENDCDNEAMADDKSNEQDDEDDRLDKHDADEAEVLASDISFQEKVLLSNLKKNLLVDLTVLDKSEDYEYSTRYHD